MKKHIWIILSVFSSCGLIAFKLISNKHKIDQKSEPVKHISSKIPVIAVTVSKTLFKNPIIKSGTLAPCSEVNIISSVQGKITELQFNLGSYVRKGSFLAKVDVQLKEASLANAHIQVEKLENDYRVYKELLAGDGTTQSKVDEIKMALVNAKNQVDQLNKQISEYEIIAPLSGIIVLKNTMPGEFVNPGSVLGKLVDISRLKVMIMMRENEVYGIRMGGQVKISTGIYPGQEFNGKISFISPLGDNTHNYPVEVMMENPSKFPLKAGTFVSAVFSLKAPEHIIQITREALVESTTGPCVYIYQDGMARMRCIKVGRNIGDNVEVTAGLYEGEKVIISGQINLQNNVQVNLIK